jgi:hypothetical protein
MGVCRTPEDTAQTRFGTVRPRVQIPGPRPNPKSDFSRQRAKVMSTLTESGDRISG